MAILRYWFLSWAILIAAVVGWRSIVLQRSPLPPITSAAVAPAAEPAPLAERAPEMPATHAIPSPDQTLADARTRVLGSLAEVPQFTAFHKDFAQNFPRLQASLLDRAAGSMAGGGTLPSSETLLWESLRVLQQSNGVLASHASAEALAAFFDARLSMLDVLAGADPRTCVDFLYGTTDPAIEGFSASHRDLVADMAMKQLAVIEDGQRRHLVAAAPSAEDLDLVADSLAAHKLNTDEIAMFLDGKSIDPPPPDGRLCELGRTYLSVLKGLPPPVRQRVYGFAAELLARS